MPLFHCASHNGLQKWTPRVSWAHENWYHSKFVMCYRKFRFAALKHRKLRFLGGGLWSARSQDKAPSCMLCSKQDKFSSHISRCDNPATTGLPAGLTCLLNLHFLIALGCDLVNWLDHGARLKATSQQPCYARVQMGINLQHCWATIRSRKMWDYFHSEP